MTESIRADEAQLHFRAVGRNGGTATSVGPDNSPLRLSTVRPLTLSQGESLQIGAPDRETVMVLVRGHVQANSPTITEADLGPRRSFVTERAYALYVAPGESVEVLATADSDLMLATAQVEPAPDLRSRVVRPEDQSPRTVGRDNWSRQVTDVIGATFPARTLVVGETLNAPGNWSSSPPHKHDHASAQESRFEESYYYRLDPKQGFGVQMLYTADRTLDAAMTVRDGDIVAIPRGYHPVVAGPGYHLYYLWVLAGSGRSLKWYEDPEHRWIKSAAEA